MSTPLIVIAVILAIVSLVMSIAMMRGQKPTKPSNHSMQKPKNIPRKKHKHH